ncbi:hypothetical protein WSS15_17410 [Acetobacter pasteurianus]|uniref:hypothetical protein n=1 Tax=Acetobacter pasteurianus TaxID=438 RepID=UPI0022C4ABD8|nr:hypothetical protein [Acetobacter pasteurianus]GLH29091.1 hypothetical protein WSS15_17410 [Acetobacter pasteurianus]
MFNVHDIQTREIISNFTAEEVADYLIAKGASLEKDTHNDGGLVFENPEWLDKYLVKYVGSEDVQKSYDEIRKLIAP